MSEATKLGKAAQSLRAMALKAEQDEFLGSEDTLIAALGFSRSTVRQAARLLEREGVLRVRRGPSGGYFATRPNAATIGRAVSAYLETLDVDTGDVTLIASALWVEAVRKAAMVEPDSRRAMADRLRREIQVIAEGASFDKVLELELKTQNEIFDVARSGYIRLIFDINLEFASRNLTLAQSDTEASSDPAFVRAWRDAKLLELNAIDQGSRELATLAAHYSRKVWQAKVGMRIAQLADIARTEG